MHLADLEKVPRGPQWDRGPQFGKHFYINILIILNYLYRLYSMRLKNTNKQTYQWIVGRKS